MCACVCVAYDVNSITKPETWDCYVLHGRNELGDVAKKCFFFFFFARVRDVCMFVPPKQDRILSSEFLWRDSQPPCERQINVTAMELFKNNNKWINEIIFKINRVIFFCKSWINNILHIQLMRTHMKCNYTGVSYSIGPNELKSFKKKFLNIIASRCTADLVLTDSVVHDAFPTECSNAPTVCPDIYAAESIAVFLFFYLFVYLFFFLMIGSHETGANWNVTWYKT